MLPNFIIAGGVATGTSFLSAALKDHPQVYLPRVQRPEPNFFHYSWKFSQGVEWYRSQWFSEVGDEVAIGERSSLLLPSSEAPDRIARTIPDIKLIFCLRNPIERAWGNYRFTVLEGLEALSFDEALDAEAERISSAKGQWSEVQPHAYVSRSRYSSTLLRYFELFGPERILLLKSEDLGAHPMRNLENVCTFLGVDPTVSLKLPPNYSSPSVTDPSLQAELRTYFGERFTALIEGIRREDDLSAFVGSTIDAAQVDRLRLNLHSGKDPLPDTSRRMLQSLLRDELASLASIVNFPIDDWR